VTETTRRPWRFAFRFALIVFAVFSVLPVWTAWYFSSWEGLGVLASFWTMLISIPRAAEQVRASDMVFEFYGPEFVKLIGLVTVSLMVGRWLGGRAEPVAIADHRPRS